MKRLISICVCVILAFALFAGCSTPADTDTEQTAEGDSSAEGDTSTNSDTQEDTPVVPDGDIVIGVSMATTGNPFYGTMVATFESYAEELGIKIIVTNADSDLQRQIQGIEDLATQGIQALIINPFEADAFADTITRLKEQGIHCITVDNDVSADTPVDAAVLTDNYGNGVAVGRKLVEAMGDEPIKAFLVSGDEGSYVGQLRRLGLFDGIIEEQLARYGKTQFEIVYQTYVDNWAYDVAAKQIQDIAPTLDFNVVLSESDVVLYQGKDTFKQMGVWDTVYKASSADAVKEVLEAFMNGEYVNGFTALNDPAALSKGAIDVALKLIAGETVARDQKAPVTVVTDAESAKAVYNPDSLF